MSRVSRAAYWRQQLAKAKTRTTKLGKACDYLRAEAARYPDQRAAAKVLDDEIDRLVKKAKELAHVTDRTSRVTERVRRTRS